MAKISLAADDTDDDLLIRVSNEHGFEALASSLAYYAMIDALLSES